MAGMNAENGKSVSGTDHIRQSVSDILGTPIGSRIMRREYGSMIPDLVDQAMTKANLLRIYSATVVALTQWEPRINIHGMAPDLEHANSGKVGIQLNVSLRDNPESNFTIQVAIGSTNG